MLGAYHTIIEFITYFVLMVETAQTALFWNPVSDGKLRAERLVGI